ncbi:MAG TPA: 6,7-dimethyl-8-ribityllumazine synthase [Magnetospirillaceae bacterium]|jgi:6,7-dimethyl-8-ribityllumazine synthase
MTGAAIHTQTTAARGARIVVIEARFYNDIADHLLRGVNAALEAAGATSRVITIPGVAELPATLAFAVKAGERSPGTWGAAGYVVLGCAIKGETDHYDHICREAMRGVQDIAVQRLLAVGNGILTVQTLEQAMARCRIEGTDHGGQAARACLRMIGLKTELGFGFE